MENHPKTATRHPFQGEENSAYLENEVIKIPSERASQTPGRRLGRVARITKAPASQALRARGSGEEQQRRLQPRLFYPWNCPFSLPPPSQSSRVVAADIHRESLWVHEHLGMVSSHRSPPKAVIFGPEGIFLLNKLEEVSFFHDERPHFRGWHRCPTYLYHQIVFLLLSPSFSRPSNVS